MAKKKTQYVGKAGHLAVMGEFALRGYNVAMPEIDHGDDVFVTLPDDGRLWRIQVKTATPTANRAVNPRSERFQCIVKESFLTDQNNNPPVLIVFALRTRRGPERWVFVVLGRSRLSEYQTDDHIGQTQANGTILFNLALHHSGKYADQLRSGGADLSRWVNNWDEFPYKEWA